MSSTVSPLLILTILLVCVGGAHAFGAGDIPDFSYVNGKAFRHGDIEGILETLAKSAGGAAAGGGILGFAKTVLRGGQGPKFNKADIKRVYFGNWLRDYSQAMDIAGLSKLTSDTLVLILSVLGFMTFGYSTREFDLTPERLGVYLPVEHIDNPKGYAEKEGDARQFHPKLRPPVEARELEIDERNGMKKYIATNDQGFDTSAALVRRIFKECIEKGRQAGGNEGEDLWEAFRLLGTGLHTLEDFPAHSNYTELVLCRMGHDVFCHVGDNVRINTPNGQAPPIVTGTFGGADFLHSLLGEATDKISQSSVTDLASKVNTASTNGDGNMDALKSILHKLPIGGGDEKTGQVEDIQNKSKAYNFNPDEVFPPEAQQAIKDILKWHDDVMRDIEETISQIPGLEDLMENLTNALNAYIYTVIAPYITPALTQVTEVLGEGSKAVIDSDDQFAVFNNDDASDPSHSMLSKDHFGLILNEPAGLVAQTIVEYSVNAIVQAWSNDSDPDAVIDKILEALHHPYYADGNSEIQEAMRETVVKWFGGLGSEGQEVIEKLSKSGVKEHLNVRAGSEEQTGGHGSSASYGQSQSYGGATGGYQQPVHSQSEGYGGQQSHGTGSYNTQTESYGGHHNESYNPDRNQSSYESSGRNTYGQSESYGGGQEGTYGSGGYRQQELQEGREENSYGQSKSHGGRQHESSYEDSNTYGGRQNDSSYGQSESYGGRNESSYGQSESYGSRHESNYGGEGHERQRPEHSSYQTRQEHESDNRDSYGSRRHHNEDEGQSYGGRHNEESEGYSGSGYSYGQSQSHRSHEREENREESGYNTGYHREQTYGRDNDESGYGGGNNEHFGGHHSYGREDNETSNSGYHPSYERPERSEDDTFGAERLNIDEDSYRSRNQNDEYNNY